jgi:hypothetical protein
MSALTNQSVPATQAGIRIELLTIAKNRLRQKGALCGRGLVSALYRLWPVSITLNFVASIALVNTDHL